MEVLKVLQTYTYGDAFAMEYDPETSWRHVDSVAIHPKPKRFNKNIFALSQAGLCMLSGHEHAVRACPSK
jgi:hypothetical protein